MLVFRWDVQATIQRINKSLIARGYLTWFDLTHMNGSVTDAMSAAVEGAACMLYGVSLACESRNDLCRTGSRLRDVLCLTGRCGCQTKSL